VKRAVFVGGGAAGFFGAVTFAAEGTGAEAVVMEKGPQFLQKVRISGGGRCNVTHAMFEPREVCATIPTRRARVDWFVATISGPRHRGVGLRSAGVKMKAEEDGRMFPITDSSQTIIDCLLGEARKLGGGRARECYGRIDRAKTAWLHNWSYEWRDVGSGLRFARHRRGVARAQWEPWRNRSVTL